MSLSYLSLISIIDCGHAGASPWRVSCQTNCCHFLSLLSIPLVSFAELLNYRLISKSTQVIKLRAENKYKGTCIFVRLLQFLSTGFTHKTLVSLGLSTRHLFNVGLNSKPQGYKVSFLTPQPHLHLYICTTPHLMLAGFGYGVFSFSFWKLHLQVL